MGDGGLIKAIPYCFVDKRSFDMVGADPTCRMRKAMQLWSDALGGAPSERTGHSLALGRSKRDDDYCCTKYYYGIENQPLAPHELRCDWDDKRWPEGTLAIHWVDGIKMGQAAEGTVGYVWSQDLNRKDRHWLGVNDKARPLDIAHELGHGQVVPTMLQ
jgi:hypothetical protein